MFLNPYDISPPTKVTNYAILRPNFQSYEGFPFHPTPARGGRNVPAYLL